MDMSKCSKKDCKYVCSKQLSFTNYNSAWWLPIANGCEKYRREND